MNRNFLYVHAFLSAAYRARHGKGHCFYSVWFYHLDRIKTALFENLVSAIEEPEPATLNDFGSNDVPHLNLIQYESGIKFDVINARIAPCSTKIYRIADSNW